MTSARKLDDTAARITSARFVPLSEARALLGESPVWSSVHQAIWWVDITGCKLLRTTLAGVTQFWDTPEMPGFVQCLGDAVFVGMQSGIFRFDASGPRFEKCVDLDAQGQRFNDACTDGQGRIWAGTMDMDNQRANGVLYLFDPDRRTLVPKIDGFRTINGLAWDDTNQRLFVSDSHVSIQTVWTCPVDPEGQIGDRTEFARFHEFDGRPDGAVLDQTGHYWIAGVGGGRLYHFSPGGAVEACYKVPLESPTKPALIETQATAMVLTSFKDDSEGGRLAIWRNPPLDPVQERHAHD